MRENLNLKLSVAGGGMSGLTAVRRRAQMGCKVAVWGRHLCNSGYGLLSGHQAADFLNKRLRPGWWGARSGI